MKIQLARLLGGSSSETKRSHKTDADWRRAIRKILVELDRYQRVNVNTDGLHALHLASGLYAAHHATENEDDFWPGVVEGLVRYVLVLMGDYPDHRRRKGGRRKNEHYSLDRLRSLTYRQDAHQRLLTVHSAVDSKAFGLEIPMWQILEGYYALFGYAKNDQRRLEWFKAEHPEVYSRIV